jgi:hypothetical protein
MGREGASSGSRAPLKLIDQSHDYDELRDYLVREKKQQVEPEHNIDYLFTEYSWAGGMILVAPRKEPARFL